MILQNINSCRQALGESPCVDKIFYDMYDMDLEDLQMIQLDYESKVLDHSRKGQYTQYCGRANR